MAPTFKSALCEGKNCTLADFPSACVQCALDSLTVPKGRRGRAKTIFFLHQLSINELIFSIRFFKLYNQIISMLFGLLALHTTVGLCIVWDFETINFQFTINFN